MSLAQTFFINSLSLLLVILRTKLKFLGRELLVDQSCADMAYFHFVELCNRVSYHSNYTSSSINMCM